MEFSPVARLAFLGPTNPLEGRQAFALYKDVRAHRPQEEAAFDGLMPPPLTFESWFAIINLHIRLLIASVRGLPARHYKQALLDHFLIDVENQIRAVLEPPSSYELPTSYTSCSSLHINPEGPEGGQRAEKAKPPGRTPDRFVIRQMNIFQEQWLDMGLLLSLWLSGLTKGLRRRSGGIC